MFVNALTGKKVVPIMYFKTSKNSVSMFEEILILEYLEYPGLFS